MWAYGVWAPVNSSGSSFRTLVGPTIEPHIESDVHPSYGPSMHAIDCRFSAHTAGPCQMTMVSQYGCNSKHNSLAVTRRESRRAVFSASSSILLAGTLKEYRGTLAQSCVLL